MLIKIYQKQPALLLIHNFLFAMLMSSHTSAQNSTVGGELVTCKITVHENNLSSVKANKGLSTTNKSNSQNAKNVYEVKPNQIGFFDQVSFIQPNQIVSIEIAYPNGEKGDQILMSAEDGGKFEDGKRISASQLNAQKKLFFKFQVAGNLGMYRISLRKGNDSKVVQLWVGGDSPSSRN